jgi:hypothetical protein
MWIIEWNEYMKLNYNEYMTEKKREKKVWMIMKKSWEIEWDCWKRLLCVFLTKKSHKIHSMKESVEICKFLNTKRHFRSLEKSQLNTNGFWCLEKKIFIVFIEYLEIFLNFIKVLIEYHKIVLSLKSLLKSFEILHQYTPLVIF